MAFSIAWYIERRIVYVRLYDIVTVEEMTTGSQQLTACLETGIPLVHILVDDRDLKSTPTNIRMVSQALTFLRHPSLGWLLSIGSANPVFSFVQTLVGQLFGVRSRHFSTAEDALEFLQQQDLTLPWAEGQAQVLKLGE